MATVEIYTTHYCPYCVMAKRLLDKKKIPFEEIDVQNNPEKRMWLAQASGQRTVPQIFIHGEPIGGFTELSSLESSGKLDKLFQSEE